jgi:hypothetical protein
MASVTVGGEGGGGNDGTREKTRFMENKVIDTATTNKYLNYIPHFLMFNLLDIVSLLT